MKPQPHHLRSQGRKQYFIPKTRYEARMLEDAHKILKLERQVRELNAKLAEYEG